MANLSRTYKLRLSQKGVDCFHDGHHRLGRLVRELQPYGTTLFVAVTLLERLDCSDLAAEIETPRCAELAGDISCFVGFPQQLAQVVDRVSRRMEASDEYGAIPVGKLYIAAILTLIAADNGQILQAYRSACAIRQSTGSPA